MESARSCIFISLSVNHVPSNRVKFLNFSNFRMYKDFSKLLMHVLDLNKI